MPALRAAPLARGLQSKLDDPACKYVLSVTASGVQTLELATPEHPLAV